MRGNAPSRDKRRRGAERNDRLTPWSLGLLRRVLRLPEPTDTYVMNVAFVVVFGGGVTVLTLLLLPPRPENLSLPANTAVAVVAALTAVAVAALRHRALPPFVIHALTALGTALITVVVAYGGDATTQFAVFYLWMVVYAAAFFTLTGWSVHVVLAIAGYLLAARIHPDPQQLVDFAPVIAGPALVVGGFVHVVTARMRAAARRLLECVQISGDLVTDTPEHHDVLAAICQASRRACEATTTTLIAPDPDDTWRVAAYDGGQPIPAEEVTGIPAHDDQPSDRAAHEPWFVTADRAAGQGSRLVHPLHDGELMGVLVVDWDRAVARLSDVVAHLLRAYAQQATTALRYHRVHRSLTELAATDALTNLPNRRAFETAMAAYRARGRRNDDSVALALFDLDGFKAFNDTHGHTAGDQLLCDTAAAWSKRLRHQDLLVRLGGDEFALLIPNTSLMDTVALVHELCALVPSAEVSCSAGVATWASDEPLAELLETVDQYLYAAKQDGGGQVRARPDHAAHRMSPSGDEPGRFTAPGARSGARPRA